MNTETVTYSDGTTATGPMPLPAFSPAQQDAIDAEEARILALTDDEVIAEFRARGEDPAAVADSVMAIISKCISDSGA
jgi:hypothetical protein